MSRRESFWDEYIGLPPDEVPKIAPDRWCNAKCTAENDEGERVFMKYCSLAEGARRNVDYGRCKYHNPNPDYGPANSERPTRGGTLSDPFKYAERLEPEHREFVDDLTETILDRVNKPYEDVDLLDRYLARRIAIKMHIAAHATRYIARDGPMEQVQVTTSSGASYQREMAHDLLQHIRQYDKEILGELRDLGVMTDDGDGAVESLARLISEAAGRD